MTLTQCTLSDNSTGSGGAINNIVGTLTLTQCTLSGNSASRGGAIYNESALTLQNTILAGNTALEFGPDVYHFSGTITASGKNLIGNLSGSGLNAGTTVIVNSSPLIAPLGNYGGPTQTMPLLPGSPARNAAVGSTFTSDQRGFPIVGVPDIGAYEAGTAASYEAYIWEILPANATPAQRAASFDFDGDGATNLDEFTAGTSAESAASVFLPVATLDEGDLLISFPTLTGRTYSLQHSDTLADGSWVNTALSTAGAGNAQSFRIPFTPGITRDFFRVVVTQP